MTQPSVSNDEILIFDGKGLPQARVFTKAGLQIGQTYYFRVSALNFNGEGPKSSQLTVKACIAPQGSPQPKLVSSTIAQITLSWEIPESDGGCPVTGYAIFRDDGNGGAITTEVNSANDVNV